MNRKLRKDPIVEATCTIQFVSEEWDWTVAGLLWAQVRETYPDKQQLDWVPQGVPEDAEETMGLAQFNFWRRDKTALIKLEPNQLSIVQRAPYVGWPRFRKIIHDILGVYTQVASSELIDSIELRYINRPPLPSGDFDPSEYFNIYPVTPNAERYDHGPWILQSQYYRAETNVKLVMSTGILLTRQEGDENKQLVGGLLDIRAKPGVKEQVLGKELDWLDSGHDEIESMFYSCLTPKYLDLLEPEEENANT